MVMASLLGHAAGNGRYSQSEPTATRRLLYSESCVLIVASGMPSTLAAPPIVQAVRMTWTCTTFDSADVSA